MRCDNTYRSNNVYIEVSRPNKYFIAWCWTWDGWYTEEHRVVNFFFMWKTSSGMWPIQEQLLCYVYGTYQGYSTRKQMEYCSLLVTDIVLSTLLWT